MSVRERAATRPESAPSRRVRGPSGTVRRARLGRRRRYELLTPLVRRSVDAYCADLPRLLTAGGAGMAVVAEARMTVTFDTAATRWAGGSRSETPYECRVVITDDVGKTHEALLTGWW